MTLEPLGFPGPQQHGLSHAKQQELLRKVRKPLTVDKRTMWMRETSGGTVIGVRPTGKGGINCRWFRVMTDSQVVSLPNNEETDNDLRCRTHDCEGNQVPDDAPSVWGIWEDVEDCTWYVVEQDPTPTLVYFPQYRAFCTQGIPPTPEDKCRGGVSDPECRKNRHVFACFNTIGQRWEAVNDVEDCLMEEDVSHIYICTDNAIPGCCIYDALKIDFWPHETAGYCGPSKERDPIWAFCANGNQNLSRGFCGMGVKICDAFECLFDETGSGAEPVLVERPVYLIECGDCPTCVCPHTDPELGGNYIRFRINVQDPTGPCGYIHGIEGTLHCLDENPFVAPGSGIQGWYAHFTVQGVSPRLIYWVQPNDHDTYPNGVWLEVSCGGQGVPEGTIQSAWTENPLPAPEPPWLSAAIPTPQDYESGIEDCAILTDENGAPLYDPRTYHYGIWLECIVSGPPGGPFIENLANFQLYWLKPDFTTTIVTPACSGSIPTIDVISDPSQVISGAKSLQTYRPCCDNFQRACLFPEGLVFGCNAPTFQIPDLQQVPPLSGTTECSPCNHPGGGHIFGGCPCNWIELQSQGGVCWVDPNGTCVDDPWPDSVQTSCCLHPGNQICFDFEWPHIFDEG